MRCCQETYSSAGTVFGTTLKGYGRVGVRDSNRPFGMQNLKTALLSTLIALTACGHDNMLRVDQLEDPKTCKGCHPNHFAQWASSMHAYASDDPLFVALNRRGQREAHLGTFCVRCHAPMAVALGLTDGTNFDPANLPPAARGVTCYFCHDVAKVVDDHNNGLVLAFDDTMRAGVRDPPRAGRIAHGSTS